MNVNAIEKATAEITKTLEECSIATIQALPQMQQTIALAKGMKAMRAAMTDEIVKELLLPLQGTPLGFRTDRDDKGGYDVATVRDCAIEAMVRGFHVVGNEFNIIAGRAYFTREAFERKVREFPGLTNLELSPGVPHHVAEKGALVPYRATWLLNGARMDLAKELEKSADGSPIDRRIPVKVNAAMGADAILGKARRKMLAAIYERLTGADWTVPDGDVFETEGVAVDAQRQGVAAATADLVAKHKAKQAGKNGSETKAAEPETKPANGETKSVDDLVNKHRPPSSPTHDPAAGEVPPENEPPMREPGAEG